MLGPCMNFIVCGCSVPGLVGFLLALGGVLVMRRCDWWWLGGWARGYPWAQSVCLLWALGGCTLASGGAIVLPCPQWLLSCLSLLLPDLWSMTILSYTCQLFYFDLLGDSSIFSQVEIPCWESLTAFMQRAVFICVFFLLCVLFCINWLWI